MTTTDPLRGVSTRQTPQSERDPGEAGDRQQLNAAGGYAFTIDMATRVRRFLTLGTTGGTYYTKQQELTKDRADDVLMMARYDTRALVDMIVDVSVSGRAPRQNPALFALAACASLGDVDGRREALFALQKVARTGTHLFLFVGYAEQFRGWGRAMRRAVAGWYEWDADHVAYQAAKYRQREGWTHRDLLRLSHPSAPSDAHRALYEWICRGNAEDHTPAIIGAFTAAQNTTSVDDWTQLIRSHRLSWEMLPDAALAQSKVWETLVAQGMPQTALMRQLPRLTRLGVLKPFSSTLNTVVTQLQDADRLAKGRVHPISVLVALRTYASGAGSGATLRGREASTWTPVADVVDALDRAFYAAYGAVAPSGKRTLLALDVSGSMSASASGLPISCREVTAALALVTKATEQYAHIVGFTASPTGRTTRGNYASWSFLREPVLTPLAISPRQRMNDALKAVDNLPFGATDCSLPMVWAREEKLPIDTFVVLTDNETWAGQIHPHQALQRYREQMSIDAKQVVVGMTATDVSIADPADPGTLDVAGFDSAVPQMIADFSRGDL